MAVLILVLGFAAGMFCGAWWAVCRRPAATIVTLDPEVTRALIQEAVAEAIEAEESEDEEWKGGR